MCSEAADPCGTFPARSFCFAGYLERREDALLILASPKTNKKERNFVMKTFAFANAKRTATKALAMFMAVLMVVFMIIVYIMAWARQIQKFL